MSKVSLIARYLLAVMMIVFGLNKFLFFLEMPEPTGFAAEYMSVIAGSYIFKTIAIIYLVSAVLLLVNKAVGLATILLAPIAFNAFMYHLTLDVANIAGAVVFVVLLALVMIGNSSKYKALLS